MHLPCSKHIARRDKTEEPETKKTWPGSKTRLKRPTEQECKAVGEAEATALLGSGSGVSGDSQNKACPIEQKDWSQSCHLEPRAPPE